MIRDFRGFLHPFRAQYRRYIAGVVVRQALVVLGGYSLVLVLRLCLQHTAVPEWVFVAAFICFDAASIRYDLALNYLFTARISYPLFSRMRTHALETCAADAGGVAPAPNLR